VWASSSLKLTFGCVERKLSAAARISDLEHFKARTGALQSRAPASATDDAEESWCTLQALRWSELASLWSMANVACAIVNAHSVPPTSPLPPRSTISATMRARPFA
jgi:hypothetical protein